MGRTFVTGDIHGNPQLSLSSSMFPQGKHLSKDDVVIILGDFGLFWSKYRTIKEEKHLKWLDNQPWTTCFIDGNHENFDLLDKLPQKQKFGGIVGIAGYSIYHLLRGNIYNINNHSFLALGGAHSCDRFYRTWGKSMWIQEEITQENIDLAISNLSKSSYSVDYILTHCAPIEFAKYAIPSEFTYKPDPSEEKLSFLKSSIPLSYRQWYFGHYHNNAKDPFMGYWTCLYDVVEEIPSAR